jgi:hypothetical protein
MNIINTTICDYEVIEYNNSNVYIIKNILDSSFCNIMIDIINKVKLEEKKYEEHNNVICYTTNMKELLETDDKLNYVFSTEKNKYNNMLIESKKGNIYINKLNCVSKELIKECIKTLNEKMKTIKKIMDNINKTIISNNTCNFCIRKIHGATRMHTDGIKEENNILNSYFIDNKNKKKYINWNDEYTTRLSSLVFQLNDDYDGGLFIFPKYDISIKLEKGSVIIFPPYWTHKHGTTELVNNTFRYTINTWSCI